MKEIDAMMPRRARRRVRITAAAATVAVVAVAAAVGASGCGSSSPGDTPPYAICADDVHVGQFLLDLKPMLGDAPAYSQVNGLVRDGVIPNDLWESIAHAGGCEVLVGPVATCAPDCEFGMVCRAGACVAAPAAHSVGVATMTGLAVPLTINPNATNASYYGAIPTGTPFPPYEVGATIGLDTDGGDYPALSFEARGIAPIDVPDGQTLAITTTTPNPPLTVRWTPPPAGGAGRVRLSFDIAHHGGIAARLECDVPDTGSTAVPGTLLDTLAARGTAGFPELVITRASSDTATISPGCVQFDVASSVPKQLSVEAVTSCTGDEECTAPQICLPALKCGAP